MMTALQGVDKKFHSESLMATEGADGKKMFGTRAKAQIAYDFFNKENTSAIAKHNIVTGNKGWIV